MPTLRYTRKHLLSAVPWISEDCLFWQLILFQAMVQLLFFHQNPAFIPGSPPHPTPIQLGVQNGPLPREVIVAEVQALKPLQQCDLIRQLGQLVVTEIQKGDVGKVLQMLCCDAHDGIVAQVKLLMGNARYLATAEPHLPQILFPCISF